jgi:hypothetical protein
MTVSLVRINHDRRDPVARAALQRRVRGEFEEMPGTCLTCPQARRLFGLNPDVCERVLGALVREGILSRTTGDRYRLNDSTTWPGHRAFPSPLTSATSKAS